MTTTVKITNPGPYPVVVTELVAVSDAPHVAGNEFTLESGFDMTITIWKDKYLVIKEAESK